MSTIEDRITTLSEMYTTNRVDRIHLKNSLHAFALDIARAQREADLDHPWVDEELTGSIRNTPLVVPSTEDA
jgi:hypothetical protein